MLFRIGLEIVPQLGREGVFGLDGLPVVIKIPVTIPWKHGFSAVRPVQDRGKARPLGRQLQIVPCKGGFLAKANDDDPFAVLRGEVLAVDDSVVYVIAQLVAQGLQDDAERVAPVVRKQVLDVLQKECLGPLGGDDPRHVKEQCSLCRAFKAVGSAKRVFLGDTGDGERLAREACQQHVVIGDIPGRKGNDVANKSVPVAEVLDIGFFRKPVPFARKDTFSAVSLEAHADAANPCEQVNEPEPAAVCSSVRVFFAADRAVPAPTWTDKRLLLFPIALWSWVFCRCVRLFRAA